MSEKRRGRPPTGLPRKKYVRSEAQKRRNVETTTLWRQRNKERVAVNNKSTYDKAALDPIKLEHRRAVKRKWAKENLEKFNLAQRNYRAKPSPSIAVKLRTRLAVAMGRNSSSSPLLEPLLGCTTQEFRRHIESQFTDGMTWENRGAKWELDHIRPCSSFDLTNPEQQRECFHYSNIRPLKKMANRYKSAHRA